MKNKYNICEECGVAYERGNGTEGKKFNSYTICWECYEEDE